MAEITAARNLIQSEETAYRAAVSESTLTKVGAHLNFVSHYQYDTKAWFFNGPYSNGGAQTNIDGPHIMLFDMEIVGCAAYVFNAGSSGTTTFDIKRRTASGGAGVSIFSTPPAILYTAGNNVWVERRLQPTNVIIENPAGTTAPVLSTTSLDAGDMLTFDLTGVQTGSSNCGIILYVRPR